MSETRGLLSKAVVLGAAVVLVASIIVMSVGGNVATAGKSSPLPPARFVDNLDGTVTDTLTGLMWEQKTGTVGSLVSCSTAPTCADPTNVNNLYSWSSSGSAADGMLFTDFLAKMNCTVLQFGGACGPGLHRDWRIPTSAELQSIQNCLSSPCIDPIFGPTAASNYWSSSSFAGNPANAWFVNFAVATRTWTARPSTTTRGPCGAARDRSFGPLSI